MAAVASRRSRRHGPALSTACARVLLAACVLLAQRLGTVAADGWTGERCSARDQRGGWGPPTSTPPPPLALPRRRQGQLLRQRRWRDGAPRCACGRARGAGRGAAAVQIPRSHTRAPRSVLHAHARRLVHVRVSAWCGAGCWLAACVRACMRAFTAGRPPCALPRTTQAAGLQPGPGLQHRGAE